MNTKRANWTTGMLLGVGIVIGVVLSYVWPHEPVQATVTDRTDRFALVTVPASTLDTLESVFVLDFLTGRLVGGALNARTGKFTQPYFRNIAADFQVDPTSKPTYAILGGSAQLPSQRGVQFASGVVYVAELSSGKVAAYAYPYTETQRMVAPQQLVPLDGFSFRERLSE